MKKTFSIIAAVLFVLSFAGAALAIHAEIPAETQAVVAKSSTQITLGGEIRVRGWYTHNLGTGYAWHEDSIFVPAYNYYAEGFVSNVWRNDINTHVNAFTAFGTRSSSFSKFGVQAPSKAWYDQRVRLYVDAKVSDNVQGYVMLETGTADQPGMGGMFTSTADKYFWGNFNSKPNTSMGILEAWMLYKGTGLFGFNSGIKVGHMPLKLGHGQFFDHTQLGDDAIVFFMDPNKQTHIGLLTVKFAGDEGQAGGSRADNTDDLDGYVGLVTYKIDDKNTVGLNYTYLNLPDWKLSQQNLGLHADGSFGNFGYKAEVDFQFGKMNMFNDNHDDKFRGAAVLLAGNYKMNPVNIRGSFAWGSGDNNSDDHKISNFVNYVSAIQNYTLIYEYLATTTAGGVATGISNTTYYNLGLDYAATKDLSFSGDLYILRASKTGHDISKNAGWEFDAKMVYKVAKNLTYQIDAGYFKPGSFYNDTMEAAAHIPYNVNWDHEGQGFTRTKGITVLRNMLTLSF